MTDICMCEDNECPMKEKCYRHTAKPGYMQSYFYESPRDGDKCSYFMDNTKFNRESKDKED